jgi:hypothetical protein
MATDRQVDDEIRDAPEIVTSVEFKEHEQRLLANAAASEERLNGLNAIATLSRTLLQRSARDARWLLGTGPAARSARRKSTIHVTRNFSSPILPPRTGRRPRYAHMTGRPGATHLLVETRPPMVDASPLRQQRPLHLLPHRDRLHVPRQLRLRLGSSIKRAVGSTRGCWSATDQQQHITSKELKAVRLVVHSFLPLLRGRKVL